MNNFTAVAPMPTMRHTGFMIADARLSLEAYEKGDLDTALRHLFKAQKIAPHIPEYPATIAVILHEQGKYEDAAHWHRRAIAMRCQRPEALSNYANTLRAMGYITDAMSFNYKALRKDPKNVLILNNQGCVYTELGDLEEAKRHFQRALSIDPSNYMAHFNMGNVLLLEGDYREGFEEYDFRMLANSVSYQKLPFPFWAGENLDGKSILIQHEQGAGDTFQFCRMLFPLREKYPSARITFQVADSLFEIMHHNFSDVCTVVGGDHPIKEPYDYRLLLMSLCRVFPFYDGPSPYLRPIDTVQKSRNGKCSVGICWHGNPEHKNDHNRSIHDPKIFDDLLTTPFCQFFSLQQGKTYGPMSPLSMLDWRATFNMVCALDLVLTVDTSIAHVAASMGKPVWLLIPLAPDWRWGLNSDTTRWYPSVKLYRQSLRGNWRHVIENVQSDLLRLVLGTQDEAIPFQSAPQ